jgi:hypothetical protein
MSRAEVASPENSPAIYGWVRGSEKSPVPSGTKGAFERRGFLSSLAGLDFSVRFNPALKGWAIVGTQKYAHQMHAVPLCFENSPAIHGWVKR